MKIHELLSGSGTCYQSIVDNQILEYPNVNMYGTEEERMELFDLKLDLESWQVSLHHLDYWRFPNKLREINATCFRIKYWTEKANGRELDDEYKVKVAKENRKLNSEPFHIGPPDEETVKIVISMIHQLTMIWNAVSTKYIDAVVKTATTMEERIMRFDGVVNFQQLPLSY